MDYFGTVLDEGRDFAAIETEGPLVVLKITFDGDMVNADMDVAMDADQAREVARHLIAAADALTPHRGAT